MCAPPGPRRTDFGDAGLLGPGHQVVDEHAEPAAGAGLEFRHDAGEIVDAAEVFDDHALDAQVGAPYLLDEFGVVSALDVDPAGQRHFGFRPVPPPNRMRCVSARSVRHVESLTDLRRTEWRTILAKLRRARLLDGEDPHNPGCLDAHPLVREYFGEQLRSQQKNAWKECNRRLFDYYRTLAPELPDSLTEMEPLFLAVVCGCQAGLFRTALQEVYIPRIQRGNANFAANALGARGALLLVLGHFFENGHWGAPAETDAEEQRLNGEDQLFILLQAGQFLSAIRGFAAPEAQICYDRVASLCHALHLSRPLYVALVGQWRNSLMTEKLTGTMEIAERVYSLVQGENDAALMLGAHRALAVTFYFLGDFESSRQNAMHGVQIWRSKGTPSPIEEPIMPAVTCLCHQALSEWHLGGIASCQVTMAGAIALAKELNDMHALAQALWYAAVLAYYERNPAEVERHSSDLIELSTRQNFATWLAHASVLRGWVRSARGIAAEGISGIEEGLKDTRSTGVMLTVPFLLTLKSEALYLGDRTAKALEAIREGDALVQRFATRYCSAELHRLRAVFLAAMGAKETQIEDSFRAAIRTAKEQKSVSLEKRAEGTYAEYRRQTASVPEGGECRLPLC